MTTEIPQTIYFGLRLDDSCYPTMQMDAAATVGVQHFGQQGLLHFLETHLALSGHANNNTHLRIEQYRQALQTYLKTDKTPFYQLSFEADELATAKALLERRDELVLAGFDFADTENAPARLKVLAAIERAIKDPENPAFQLDFGTADRFRFVLKALEQQRPPLAKVVLNEPLALLPVHLQTLFERLTQQGVEIATPSIAEAFEDTDLGVFRRTLWNKSNGKRQKVAAKQDGSLIIIKAKRESVAAEFLAKLLRQTPDFRPLCLIPEKNRALDNALIEEGLPSLGISSASLARPVLQILKLVPTFLWRPVDPYKIMEFVSLAVKPLRDDLANLIATEIAATPGLLSERWKMAIRNYFVELEQRAETDKSINVAETRRQYNFWFKRQRQDINGQVEVSEVVEIFEEVNRWASKKFEELSGRQPSLLVLAEQAKRVCELLRAFPETEQHLSHLQLERIVKTIYEPSPVTFRPREVGFLPIVHHSSAVIDAVEELLWWDFSQNEADHFFARWYNQELNFLIQKQVFLSSPKQENERLLWQRPRAILQTQKRLVLVVSEMVNGTETQPHPLYSDIEATFKTSEALTFSLDDRTNDTLLKTFHIPKNERLNTRQLGRPKPYFNVTDGSKIADRTEETYTSLETLLYYPYKWVFKYKLKLQNTSILSVVKDATLMGNLAHRLFELLLQQKDVLNWDKEQLKKWVTKKINELLAQEGAVLLMYGREPEKAGFINRLHYSTFVLIQLLRNNGWEIIATEELMEGAFNSVKVRAKADLILKNEKGEFAILDLKWRGAGWRQTLIKSQEDLQLVLYAKFLVDDKTPVHTAFFIIEEAKLIARNNAAFKEAIAVLPDDDSAQLNESIWNKMLKTHEWRQQQLLAGKIEVRTEATERDLDDPTTTIKDVHFDDFLEMKKGDAAYDDYQTLINLVI